MKKKAEKLIEAIRYDMSPESVVCDSVMRCEGWKKAVRLYKNYSHRCLFRSFKYCPWCEREIKWDIET